MNVWLHCESFRDSQWFQCKKATTDVTCKQRHVNFYCTCTAKRLKLLFINFNVIVFGFPQWTMYNTAFHFTVIGGNGFPEYKTIYYDFVWFWLKFLKAF